MPQDYNTQFSRLQDLSTGTVAGVISTNTIPMTQPRDYGMGKKIYGEVRVVTPSVDGAGYSLDIDVVAMDATNTTVNTVLAQAVATIPGNSAAGYRATFLLPTKLAVAGDGNLALRYVARGTGALTAMTVNSGLTLEPGYNHADPRTDSGVIG